MTTRIRRGGALLSLATALWLGQTSPAQAGPIIDWFKSLCPQSAPPANTSSCNTPKPGMYYPGAPAPVTVIPGPVIPGAAPPGVVQPGYVQPGYVQPGYAQPGTTIPSTVTPGPAFPPRSANYFPGVAQAAYYPGTMVATPAAVAPNAQVAYYAPVAGGAACPTCPSSVGVNRPTTVNYAPYTSYRNTWVQVPVTVYRPVSAIDPATGRPVTVVQPCLATTWQVQRVPVAGRPFASMYQPLPVTNYGTPGRVAPAAVAPGTCPGGVCAPAAPAASWGGTVMPGTTLAPSTTVPSVPAAPSTTLGPPSTFGPTTPPSYLGQPARSVPGTSGGTFVPADQRPTLGPNEGAGTSNYPPATDPYSNPPPYIGPSAPANDSSSGASNGGSLTRPSTASPSSVSRPTDPKPAPRVPLKVTPVPDPEPSPVELPGRSVPRLIVPQERTAASRGAQPTHRIVPAITAETARSSTSVGQPVKWDDSGWRSGRP